MEFIRGNMEHILRELQKEGLVLNEGKCKWGRLNHVASVEGLRHPCTAIMEVHGFLNVAGYYRCLVLGFAKEASPLYQVARKQPAQGLSHQMD